MAQVRSKNAGDHEAGHYDAYCIRAFAHGLPAATGEGIGIDRLVMALTDRAIILGVTQFPSMRLES